MSEIQGLERRILLSLVGADSDSYKPVALYMLWEHIFGGTLPESERRSKGNMLFRLLHNLQAEGYIEFGKSEELVPYNFGKAYRGTKKYYIVRLTAKGRNYILDHFQ